ncbi:hypothetical protein VW35_10900 [Devosia soli]|uniref:HTH cro/C1-type domain-containing protein n=1 Tax=Devosia soli TaxID=361041 RepID=A0A0F5L987_9HYPH|nr:helix-turn-helix transcriptional regulator [Devosia soli]KKB78172.1 hypothetical protein VW35_10900 [Devosia soli]
MKQLSAAALLGQNVQRLRQAQGLDAALFAKGLGWSEASLRALEEGRLDVDLDTIDLLSAALNIAPHDLFETAENAAGRLALKRSG